MVLEEYGQILEANSRDTHTKLRVWKFEMFEFDPALSHNAKDMRMDGGGSFSSGPQTM